MLCIWQFTQKLLAANMRVQGIELRTVIICILHVKARGKLEIANAAVGSTLTRYSVASRRVLMHTNQSPIANKSGLTNSK